MTEGKNLNPVVQEGFHDPLFEKQRLEQELNLEIEDPVDAYEIFDMVRHINDPEHPLTLEQLNVVNPRLISVDDTYIRV